MLLIEEDGIYAYVYSSVAIGHNF